MFKYLKDTENVPNNEVISALHPRRIAFVTFATMHLLSCMNEKQKIFALIGIVSIVAFIVIGYATGDWIQDWRWNGVNRMIFSGIAWHSVIPFLIAVASVAGWFLYKDDK